MTMTHFDVVKKIIGPVIPVGDSSVDEQRYNNLKDLLNLTSDLLYMIQQVANCEGSTEASMKKAGATARRFLIETKEII